MGSIMSRLFMTNANVDFALIAFSSFTAIAARFFFFCFFFFFFFFFIVILTSIITNTMLATLIHTSV